LITNIIDNFFENYSAHWVKTTINASSKHSRKRSTFDIGYRRL